MQQKVGELLKSVYCERRRAFGMVGAGRGQEHRGLGPGARAGMWHQPEEVPSECVNILREVGEWSSAR